MLSALRPRAGALVLLGVKGWAPRWASLVCSWCARVIQKGSVHAPDVGKIRCARGTGVLGLDRTRPIARTS